MEYIRTYASAICAMAIVGAMIGALVPKNAAGRISFMCAGMIMTAIVISPLKTINYGNLPDIVGDMEKRIEEATETAMSDNRKIYDELIEENLKAYILQRSKEKEIVCDIEIECENGEITYAKVIAKDTHDFELVSGILRTECGVLNVEENVDNEEV